MGYLVVNRIAYIYDSSITERIPRDVAGQIFQVVTCSLFERGHRIPKSFGTIWMLREGFINGLIRSVCE